jgi:ankyrin repeat protein
MVLGRLLVLLGQIKSDHIMLRRLTSSSSRREERGTLSMAGGLYRNTLRVLQLWGSACLVQFESFQRRGLAAIRYTACTFGKEFIMNHFLKSLSSICLTLLLSVSDLCAGEIHEAAAAGDLNKVRTLLESDHTLLESKDNNGCTPLDRACGRNKAEVANYLIDKGANVNARNKWNQTPLHSTMNVFGQDFDLIKRLIDKGANVNAQGDRGNTPLAGAAARGDIKVAKLLIDNGADLNAYDKSSGTILHNTIQQNQQEIAKLLVECGSNLNQKNPLGQTELHISAMKGYTDLVQLLIKHGADVHAVDGNNRTALYYAAKYGYRSVTNVLIDAGTKVNTIVESNYGKAPQLTAILKSGESYLWYLGYDGYAVKTKSHLILFDPCGDIIENSQEAGLANGHINPDELAGQKIIALNTKPEWETVFVLGLEIFELSNRMQDVTFVIGFKPDAKLKGFTTIPSYCLALPNESFSAGGVQVHAIPAMLGGTAYLIEADGVKIFYAGYHVCNDSSQIVKYREKIDFLKSFGLIDIAILPVGGHLIQSYTYESYLYLLDQLSPKAVYLEHGFYEYNQYLKCAEVLRTRKIPVEYPEVKAGGDRFHYLRDGK